LIYRAGKQFTQIGALGDARIEPGRWYAVELECAGPVLTGRVREAVTGKSVGELRRLDESLSAGACELVVFMPPGGSGTVLFDDVRVEKLASAAPTEGAHLRIENKTVRLEFDRASGWFDIVDLRTQQRWPQTLHGASLPEITAAERSDDGRRLRASLKTTAGPVEMTIALEEPAEVLLTLRPAGAGSRSDLSYPCPLSPPSEKAELVLPADEGVILPATGVDIPRALGSYSYQQSGYLMPWFGLVEGERGLMALVETPDDLGINIS
jgi:hypothetical protein